MRETEGKPGKEDTRLRSERRKGPYPSKRREHSTTCQDRLSSWGDRGTWQGLLGRAICLILTRLSVGARALWANRVFPREPRMGALCPRKDRWRRDLLGLVGLRKYHLDSLLAHELHAGSPMLSATPIPEDAAGLRPLGGDGAGD